MTKGGNDAGGATNRIDALRAELALLCEGRAWRTAWSLHDVDTGLAIDGGGEQIVPAASTRKVPILLAALSAARSGALDLERKILIDRDLQDNDSGCLRYLRPGLVITLYDALVMMIIVSDNCATAAIVALLGLDAINAHTAILGMSRTVHRAAAPARSYADHPTPSDLAAANVTTANDMRDCLKAVVLGADDPGAAAAIDLTFELCRLALDILAAQQFTKLIPGLLPTHAKVAHKTGTGPSNASDVGIVYRHGKPAFILAVYTVGIPVSMTDGLPGRAAAQDHVARMARLCWDRLPPPM